MGVCHVGRDTTNVKNPYTTVCYEEFDSDEKKAANTDCKYFVAEAIYGRFAMKKIVRSRLMIVRPS